MKDLIIDWIISMVLKQLEPQMIRELARKLECFALPVVRDYKDEIFRRLHEKALETDTILDDSFYAAVDIFIDELLPRPTCPLG